MTTTLDTNQNFFNLDSNLSFNQEQTPLFLNEKPLQKKIKEIKERIELSAEVHQTILKNQDWTLFEAKSQSDNLIKQHSLLEKNISYIEEEQTSLCNQTNELDNSLAEATNILTDHRQKLEESQLQNKKNEKILDSLIQTTDTFAEDHTIQTLIENHTSAANQHENLLNETNQFLQEEKNRLLEQKRKLDEISKVKNAIKLQLQGHLNENNLSGLFLWTEQQQKTNQNRMAGLQNDFTLIKTSQDTLVEEQSLLRRETESVGTMQQEIKGTFIQIKEKEEGLTYSVDQLTEEFRHLNTTVGHLEKGQVLLNQQIEQAEKEQIEKDLLLEQAEYYKQSIIQHQERTASHLEAHHSALNGESISLTQSHSVDNVEEGLTQAKRPTLSSYLWSFLNGCKKAFVETIYWFVLPIFSFYQLTKKGASYALGFFNSFTLSFLTKSKEINQVFENNLVSKA